MRTPAAAEALEFVWIVQMLPARLTFQVHATEMLSPSGSLVVVEAWRLSFVFGEAGLKVGTVVAGTRSHVDRVVGRRRRVVAVAGCILGAAREGELDPAGIEAITVPRELMPVTATS